MKRTIKLNKADKVVISKYTPSFFTTGFSYLKTDILFVYSPSEDTYYYLNGKKNPQWDKTTYRSLGKFNSIWDKYSFINNDLTLYDILMYLNILPSDTTVISDKVWLLLEQDYKYIDNITNNYMRLIYDTELDKFISNGLEQLQDEDLQTLNTMLTSKDDSVVGMGMKLLSSYDVSSTPCAIAIMIKQNWNSLRYISVKTSVGFQQVLTSLNLSDHILDRENMLHIINRAFSTCGTDESKEKARNAVINMVFEDGKKFLTDKCEELKDFDLNFELKVY